MAAAKVTGVILTGGRSRRLGMDKATLNFGGRPLAHWVAAALRPLTDALWVVTNFPLLHAGLGLPLVLDLYPGRGAVGGLYSAFLVTETDYLLLTPCDSPFLQVGLLRFLVAQALKDNLLALACQSSRGLEPLPGLFHRALLPRIENQLQQGDLRLRRLVTGRRTRIVSPAEVAAYDPAELSFFNLNTPADLARACELLAAPPPRPLKNRLAPG